MVGVVSHSQACPNCAEKNNFQYFNNDLSYGFDFLQASKVLESCILVVLFWVGVARHAWACPKYAEITNCHYFNNDLSYCFDSLQASKVQGELQTKCHIVDRHGQACTGMPKEC